MEEVRKNFIIPTPLHSNLVLFKLKEFSLLLLYLFPLHSNLVLFKLSFALSALASLILYIPIWFYSNIPAVLLIVRVKLFTFQSGSIQMLFCVNCLLFWYLYIPIWFYSNIIFKIFKSNTYNLYIPIWFYSNMYAISITIKKCIFTFQSGSIQIRYSYVLSASV